MTRTFLTLTYRLPFTALQTGNQLSHSAVDHGLHRHPSSIQQYLQGDQPDPWLTSLISREKAAKIPIKTSFSHSPSLSNPSHTIRVAFYITTQEEFSSLSSLPFLLASLTVILRRVNNPLFTPEAAACTGNRTGAGARARSRTFSRSLPPPKNAEKRSAPSAYRVVAPRSTDYWLKAE